MAALVDGQQALSIVGIALGGRAEQIIHQHAVEPGDLRQQHDIGQVDVVFPAGNGLGADAKGRSGLFLGQFFFSAQVSQIGCKAVHSDSSCRGI